MDFKIAIALTVLLYLHTASGLGKLSIYKPRRDLSAARHIDLHDY